MFYTHYYWPEQFRPSWRHGLAAREPIFPALSSCDHNCPAQSGGALGASGLTPETSPQARRNDGRARVRSGVRDGQPPFHRWCRRRHSRWSAADVLVRCDGALGTRRIRRRRRRRRLEEARGGARLPFPRDALRSAVPRVVCGQHAARCATAHRHAVGFWHLLLQRDGRYGLGRHGRHGPRLRAVRSGYSGRCVEARVQEAVPRDGSRSLSRRSGGCGGVGNRRAGVVRGAAAA